MTACSSNTEELTIQISADMLASVSFKQVEAYNNGKTAQLDALIRELNRILGDMGLCTKGDWGTASNRNCFEARVQWLEDLEKSKRKNRLEPSLFIIEYGPFNLAPAPAPAPDATPLNNPVLFRKK